LSASQKASGANGIPSVKEAIALFCIWPSPNPTQNAKTLLPDNIRDHSGGAWLDRQSATSRGKFDVWLRQNGFACQRAGMREISLYGGDHDPSLHVKQVETHQRNSHPAINDDALIQHAVKHVYQIGSGCLSFQSHRKPPKIRRNCTLASESLRVRRKKRREVKSDPAKV